jgi:hypothetical protein
MATMSVRTRHSLGERGGAPVDVEVDEALTVLVSDLEEWVSRMEHWSLAYRQGGDFGRVNNVEVRLLLAASGHSCSIAFRLDQLDAIQTYGQELWLTLEERGGLAKAVHLAPGGLDVDLFHVHGAPLRGASA